MENNPSPSSSTHLPQKTTIALAAAIFAASVLAIAAVSLTCSRHISATASANEKSQEKICVPTSCFSPAPLFVKVAPPAVPAEEKAEQVAEDVEEAEWIEIVEYGFYEIEDENVGSGLYDAVSQAGKKAAAPSAASGKDATTKPAPHPSSDAPDTPAQGIPQGTLLVKCGATSDLRSDEPIVIDDVSTLSNMFFDGSYISIRDANGRVIGRDDITAFFDEDFFADNFLVAAFADAGSGSYGAHLEWGGLMPDGSWDAHVVIEGLPQGQLGTCDMAYWTALVPVSK